MSQIAWQSIHDSLKRNYFTKTLYGMNWNETMLLQQASASEKLDRAQYSPKFHIMVK